MRRALLFLLLLGAGSCAPEDVLAPENKPAPAMSRPDAEADNLLNLAHGAYVVDRTAEMTLDRSAVHAIDGTSQTVWASPPGGPEQTLTFGLGARTKLSEVGALMPADPGSAPDGLRFESSLDGATWTPLATMTVQPEATPQTVKVGAEARYLRVTTVAPSQWFSVVRSFLAKGRVLGPREHASIAGCWTINGRPARFEERGGRVTGVYVDGRPLLLDGDGQRFVWLQAPMWGHALFNVARDGRTLTGSKWHENPIWDHNGDGWLGVRGDCATEPFADDAFVDAFLQRAGRYTLYGDVVTAGSLDVLVRLLARHPQQRFRLTSREFLAGAENDARAQRRLDGLREALRARGVDMTGLDLVAAGDEDPGRSLANAPEKMLASAVEITISPK